MGGEWPSCTSKFTVLTSKGCRGWGRRVASACALPARCPSRAANQHPQPLPPFYLTRPLMPWHAHPAKAEILSNTPHTHNHTAHTYHFQWFASRPLLSARPPVSSLPLSSPLPARLPPSLRPPPAPSACASPALARARTWCT